MDQDALPMGWRVESTAKATILYVTGEIDLLTHPDFAEAMSSAMDTPATLVVIDMAQVTFIGSTGIQLLLDVHHQAVRSGRQMRVAHGGNQVRRTLEIAGVQHLLATYESIGDALADIDV